MADPGFPRGGGANFPGGRQHTILPNFPKNCMKLKEFGPPGGPRIPRAPLRSATVDDLIGYYFDGSFRRLDVFRLDKIMDIHQSAIK